MQAFQSIVHPNYKPVCNAEKGVTETRSDTEIVTMDKDSWSRWKDEEVNTIIDFTRQEKAMGRDIGYIIKKLMAMFPHRKYNAIYTKLKALDLIKDEPKAAKKPAPKKEKEIGLGEASAPRR